VAAKVNAQPTGAPLAGKTSSHQDAAVILMVALESARDQLVGDLEMFRSSQAMAGGPVPTAVITSFEYCHDLAIKVIRRLLERTQSPRRIQEMDLATLMCTAAKCGLVGDPAAWLTYRELRDTLPHVANESMTLDPTRLLPRFVTSVTALLAACAETFRS
jgi:hypothetical protein